MKYMLMIYGNKFGWDSLTQDQIDEIGRTHRTLQSELSASGELLERKELALNDSKVVRRSAEFLSSRMGLLSAEKKFSAVTTWLSA